MINFVDLKKENKHFEKKIKEKIDNIFFNKTNFILDEEVVEFENNFSKYINIDYCIGVANGTDALEIAIKALNLNENNEIITQANTYVSTCLGIINNNILLKIVDIDKDTYQIDLDLLEKNITEKTKAVIIVHLTGSCCNMNKLMKIINKYNLILIEDCSHSHGALYNNKRLGTYGLISTFCLNPGKNLSAFGNGGVICTNNSELSLYIKKYINNGCIEKYKYDIIGRNSRLDNFNAAVLNIKLNNLDINNFKRRENAIYYDKLLKDIEGIEIPKIENLCIPVYYLYIIKTTFRNALQDYLKKKNIETVIHYPINIYELECYKNKLNSSNYSINSIENSKKILSLPMYPDLDKKEIEYICKCIKNFFNVV